MPGPAKKKLRIQDPEVDASEDYDPDQDHEEVRGVRAKLREMEHGVKDDQTPEQMLRLLETSDKLFHTSVKGTSEAIKDSRVLTAVTGSANTQARAMKSGSGAFDVEDFVQKLVTFMGGRSAQHLDEDDDDSETEGNQVEPGAALDWELIGRRALGYSHRVPVSDFMLGPLTIEQKQRAPVKRSKLEKNKADEKKPQAITEDDITRSENETTKNVAALQRLLEKNGITNMFKFIVNPQDFGQSVENMFYLSFLIRDGTCALQVSDEGEPQLYACVRPTTEEYAEGLMKRQLVMELDMATWRRAIETFDIREALIPQRKKAETRLGGKWYG
ncbi:hypothetical protein EUX98_g1483 [Antrodiella citrinella]|uniref:Non-structural maintenance of chromosomes element 4 n=1 Tax=Antrodiella citrinella TaxID=2447956 RepID=A0A4S4N2S6_9APHY|nr:hypothetical protein EUX98_g1483 [Antrodiella citrinella]